MEHHDLINRWLLLLLFYRWKEQDSKRETDRQKGRERKGEKEKKSLSETDAYLYVDAYIHSAHSKRERE